MHTRFIAASFIPQSCADIQSIIIGVARRDMTRNAIWGSCIGTQAHEYAEDAERTWCESLPGQWDEIHFEYQ